MIVLKALEEPVRQIAANAGIEGSVIVEQLKKDGEEKVPRRLGPFLATTPCPASIMASIRI